MTITGTLRTLMFASLFAAVSAVSLRADDSAAIAAFAQAFSGSDAGAKRAAMTPIIALGRDADDTVYRLLVQAVADPQTQDVAIQALRARCAQSPFPYDRAPSFPGDLPVDTPADWNHWLALRTQYKDKERTLADESRRLDALAKSTSTAKEAAPGSATPSAAADRQHAKAETPPPSDLGPLSRIIFTDGATMVGHIVERHRDANGTELSIEIIHPDGGGREVIPIDRIARIEAAP